MPNDAISSLTDFESLPPLLTEEQLEAIGIAKRQTLSNWRCAREGPPFVKVGRAVRYPKAKLLAWLERHTVTTSR